MNSTLHVIATGGTFDKAYDPIAGKLTFSDSHLLAALERCRLNFSPTLTTLPLQDSLDMDDADRARIRETCIDSAHTHVVIIHGTDTMPETARVLGSSRAAPILRKTIVLTGAMVPYSVANSDALFNLGFACAAAQLLPPGVYIAINGAVFNWDNVQKNKIEGCFEAINPTR
jgi:L-asparaginase